MKPRIVTIFIALLALLGFVLLPSSSMSTAYKACCVPAVAGVATKPNVMIVMDYSGSMQFRAHYASASEYWNGYYSASKVAYGYDGTESYKTDAAYLPTHTYYGLFQSNTYYTYDSTNKQWSAAATQPVTAYSFTAQTKDSGVAITAWATAKAYTVNTVASDSGKSYICTTAHTSASTSKPGVGTSWTTYWTLLGTGTECILFTAAGHTFQVGQLVEFQGLTSHTGMNGNAYLVAAVSGNTFRIAFPWNGNPDQVSGSAQRRIPGTVSTGLCGNILNYATATRMDCALKALIGGPGTCDSTYCYVTGQGERSYLRESTNIQGEFYVRPCTSDSSSAYPDDYSTGTYATKTTYVSISGRYTGTISTSDSYTGSGSSKYYYHAWKFTTTGASHIDVTLTGTWSSGTSSYVALFSSTSFSGTATTSASGSPAVLSYDISSAGTYYLVVRSNTKNVTGTYTLSASQELTAYTYNALPTRLCPPGDSTGQSSYAAIGSIPQAQIKIKEALADRMGVIQQTFNQVRYGLTYYNSDNEGKILVGCHNTSLSTLVSAFTSVYPYNGTPTGEALYEALDYFKQSADHTYASNTSFISKGTSLDPYYQKDINGVAQPVPCRQSYVVLISDGGWNGNVDPVKPARELHAFDLRTETTPTDPTSSPANQPYFRDTQSVNVFSIFAFGTEDCGKRSMKGVAMFGGFTDGSTSSCGSSNTWPYPYTAYPSTSTCEQSSVTCSDTATGSRCMKWPQTNCDPSGTYNDCCKEWDTKWDSYTSGDNLDKGLPDSYFEASEGQALQSALMTVIQSSIVKNATASAVATVAQGTQEGDIIVRGLFHAADPETVGKYLWFGHLEAYWPYLDESTMVYHYDFETNPCFQITTGTKHCWDGAQILQSRDTNDRTLYSWDPSTKAQLTVPIVPTSGSIDPPWTSTLASTWQTKLGVTTSPTPSDLISWIRGIDVDTLRTRTDSDNLQWRLGDIVYSTPVVVGTPSVGGISVHDPNRDEFYAYRNQQYYRDKVIYVGANDGMIHAFLMAHWDSTSQTWLTDPSQYADIGKELWAYIPSNLLTEFQYVANSGYGANDCLHRSMVDLAPQSWEVYILPPGATTRSWRTVVLGGERGGGDVYFAIDVTDPYNAVVLWEYSMFMNRIVYDRTGTRSLTNCAAHPSDSYSDTYCKAANLDKAWLFVDTSSSPNSGSPTASTYQTQLKVLPVAWSRPAVGRLRIPASLSLYAGDPAMPEGQSPTTVSSFNFNDLSPWPQTINNTSYHMPRHVAFVGGGVRIFQDDTRVEKDPLLSSAPTIDGVTSAAYRFDLFRPDFMAIDIETGTNLFRYYWPLIQDQTTFQYSSATKLYTLFPAEVPFPQWETGTAYIAGNMVSYGGTSYLCLVANTASSSNTPGTTAGATYWSSSGASFIPNAFADPLALDVRSCDSLAVGDDGYVDTIYAGDLAGNFYGLKLNFDGQVKDSNSGSVTSNTSFGIRVDWWQTKETYIGQTSPTSPAKTNTNTYRGLRQPITVPPVASFDGSDTNFLHVIFGAGKFEDMADSACAGCDDKSDLARTSIYNLKDLVQIPTNATTGTSAFFTSNAQSLGGFKVEVVSRCPTSENLGTGTQHTIYNYPKSGDSACTWTKDTSSTDATQIADCCEASCSSPANPSDPNSDPCWNCVYDLTLPSSSLLLPGQRVVRKGLIAGGLLFITTFIPPQTMCQAQGTSYLYILSYDCGPVQGTKCPITDTAITATGLRTGSTNSYDSRGWVVALGTGVASNPVLDSTGTHVVIQMSTGEIWNMGVDLPQKVIQPLGWRER